jgi:hypothetical protein
MDILDPGHAEAYLVETLYYKPEDRGFDSRQSHWIFSCLSPSSRNMPLESNQLPTEMGNTNLPVGKGWPACKAENVKVICEPIVRNVREPQSLTTLWTSTAFYGIALPFTFKIWTDKDRSEFRLRILVQMSYAKFYGNSLVFERMRYWHGSMGGWTEVTSP